MSSFGPPNDPHRPIAHVRPHLPIGHLDAMTHIAEAARDLPDARVQYLFDWIRKNLCPGDPPVWNDTRPLIFTEYEDTQRYLRRQLEDTFAGMDNCIAVYSGPTPENQREIKQAFNDDPTKYPLRVSSSWTP